MALTTTQIQELRDITGDVELQHNGEYIQTDDQIQELWTNARSRKSVAVCLYLQVILGWVRRYKSGGGSFGDGAGQDSVFRQTMDLYKVWRDTAIAQYGSLFEADSTTGDVSEDPYASQGIGVMKLNRKATYTNTTDGTGWYD